MLKKTLIIAILTLFALSAAAFADEGPGGNKRKGKYTYRKLIKTCYERGAVDSESPKVSPADKPMAEWKEIFEKKDFTVFGCDQEWAAAGETDILDIYSYFYSFAKDSPTPATCK